MSDGSSDLFYNVKFSREFSINGQNNIIDEMRINENLVNESLIHETLDTSTSIEPELYAEDISSISIYPIIIGLFAAIGIYILVYYV